MKNRVPGQNKRVSNTRQRKQQHLLEVTIRRDIARKQQTRKIIRGVCKLILIAGLIIGVFVGGKETLRRFLWENPDYYLTDVRFPMDGPLTHEQILAAGGIVVGRNIFSIDLAKAREGIEKLPQVEVAEIQRVLPNRLDINIVERKPIAWATAKVEDDPSISEKSFLIDARGVVMRSKKKLHEYLLLPIISGVDVDSLTPGQTVRTFEMQAALDLLRLNAESTRFQIRNIDISKGYCLVVTDRTHARVTFGLDLVDQQLARLNRLLDRVQLMQRDVQTVNLLVQQNVPVTFADPPAAEPDLVIIPPVSRTDNARERSLPIKTTPAPKATPAPAKATPAPTPFVSPASPNKIATPPPTKPVGTGNRSSSKSTTVKKPFRP